ncbi:AcrVA2 family anti-CRISPR protein [Leptospira noguchii]|uniref:Uncharacterized protein n=1 Tax=Leptospira noguchii TaxID=28182 RepID=M6VLE7_9LEPT|nr:hypothetical protein [Leptospira noguchii]EMO53904.1 hypothetical protein LEP1GSC172_3276 [Leptospira noguchii]
MRTSRRKSIKQKSRVDLICNKVLTDYPNWIDIAKNALAQKDKDIPDWPDFVFAPLTNYFPLLFKNGINPNDPHLSAKMLVVSQLAAIVPWSLSKGVYKITEELALELCESQSPDKIPTEILKKLPQWSIYIEIPENFIPGCNGFFCHLDTNQGRDELKMLLDFDDKPPYPLTLIMGDYTIDTALELFIKNIKTYYDSSKIDNALELIKIPQLDFLHKLLPLILYICADNSEISGPYSYNKYIQKTRYKKEFELKQADNVVVWDVGKELGIKIKKYKQSVGFKDMGPKEKSPHIRRAHWHHFWTGNSEERKLILRWLSPIPVNLDN